MDLFLLVGSTDGTRWIDVSFFLLLDCIDHFLGINAVCVVAAFTMIWVVLLGRAKTDLLLYDQAAKLLQPVVSSALACKFLALFAINRSLFPVLSIEKTTLFLGIV